MSKKQTLNVSIADQIELAEISTEPQSVGTVQSFGDGVATIVGLDDVQAGELVDLGKNTFGLALNLNKTSTGIVALGDANHLKPGNTVKRTGRILSVGVSDDILGRVVDTLGRPLDGGPEISIDKYMLLEKRAPGIMPRKSVSVPLQTGIKAIDAMIPIGRGQRELIIGDRSTGKTAVALGTILNQAGENVICVYVNIGQKRSSLAQITQILEENNAFEYTTIVSASASVSAAEKFLAPYAGQAIAEYFLEKGKDVLIIFDDLTKHADAYREISLLLRRPSGREAYPGDVFYLHSRLLERSCRLNDENGGGSITALPIIETQQNDVSAFIPTNVISITDGQIYLQSDLFNAGMKPAINVGLSVSRVGSAAQRKAMKQVAGTMKLDLAQFRELQAFAQFASDLDDRTKSVLERGQRVNEILKQGWDEPLKMEEQVVIIFAAVKGHLDTIQLEKITEWEEEYLEYIKTSHPEILKEIATELKVSDALEAKLTQAVTTFLSLSEDYSS
ncbi:MAG: F0F1 ATP synthase subunit alpha [Microgenomates group bacterium]